ncbi:MAG: hypothetical protein GXO35_03495 [Gammaproteobacteria bacterium]|nr:hypothetical protein [Gammaproteobacteria bacterium]
MKKIKAFAVYMLKIILVTILIVLATSTNCNLFVEKINLHCTQIRDFIFNNWYGLLVLAILVYNFIFGSTIFHKAVETCHEIFDMIFEKLKEGFRSTSSNNLNQKYALLQLIEELQRYLAQRSNNIKAAINHILDEISLTKPSDNKKQLFSYIVGVVIAFVFWVIFVITDLVQLIDSMRYILGAQFDQTLNVIFAKMGLPEVNWDTLGFLTIVVMASITIFVLSIVLGELFDFTHLWAWTRYLRKERKNEESKSQSKLLKALPFVVSISLIFVIVAAVFITMARSYALYQDMQNKGILSRAASFAVVAYAVIPIGAYIVTALLFPSVYIFHIAVLLILSVILVISEILRGVIHLFANLLETFENNEKIVNSIILSLFAIGFFVLFIPITFSLSLLCQFLSALMGKPKIID